VASSFAKAVPGRPLLTYLRYNRPYLGAYIGGSVIALLFTLMTLVMPLLISWIVGQFAAGTMTMAMLTQTFALLLALALISAVARYCQRVLMIRASRKFEYDLRNDFFQHLQSLSRSFFNRTKTGDLMTRSTSDLEHVRAFVGPGIMGGVDMLRIPFTLAMMFYISLPLTLMSLIPLPFVSIVVYFMVMYMHRQSKKVQERFSVVTSSAQENLSGARVVKAYASADREVARFEAASKDYMRESLRMNSVGAIAWVVIPMMVGVSILIIIGKGGMMVINGEIGIDDLTAFTLLTLGLTWPLAQFGWILNLYQRGSVSMKRILDIMAETPEIADANDTRRDVQSLDGRIVFENVSFGFDDRPVLKDISFAVNPGETLAVVGPTGSGKSTIVSLITREYDPRSGRVLVDDIDAREVPLATLRGAIGYVPQDGFLFSDSVRANLTFGRVDASGELIDSASDISQFGPTVPDLPKGLDTLLGERGVNLSGGQKQRLTIARAIVREPAVLVMDDALSSVDTHTEEEILKRLKDFSAKRTTVLIAHRLSSIQHADQILFLNDGVIAERGTHDELLALDGAYADLYRRQLLEDELEHEQ
jgi:ATP-binding cassette subfamily B protein